MLTHESGKEEAARAGLLDDTFDEDGPLDLHLALDVDWLLHLHQPLDVDGHFDHPLDLHLDHPLHLDHSLHLDDALDLLLHEDWNLHPALDDALDLHRHLDLDHAFDLDFDHAFDLDWHLDPALDEHFPLHENGHFDLFGLRPLQQPAHSRAHRLQHHRQILVRLLGKADLGSQSGEPLALCAEGGLQAVDVLLVEGVLAREQVDQLPQLGLVVGLPAQLGEVVQRLPAVRALLAHYQYLILEQHSAACHSLRASPLPPGRHYPQLLPQNAAIHGVSVGINCNNRSTQVFYQYTEAMLEKGSEDCDEEYEGDQEQLLSRRIAKLSLQGLTAKSLASLPHTEPCRSIASSPLTFTTGSLPPMPPTRPTSKQNSKEKSFPALKNTRRQSPCLPRGQRSSKQSRKESYRLEDGRMFELLEGRTGREATISEVRHVRVRDFSGRGLLVFPNGKKFEGEWVEGLLVGRARITHPCGDIYLGDTYLFNRHGRGTLLYATGQRYEGEFSSGDFHGEGTLFDRQGRVLYEGEWRRGKKHDR